MARSAFFIRSPQSLFTPKSYARARPKKLSAPDGICRSGALLASSDFLLLKKRLEGIKNADAARGTAAIANVAFNADICRPRTCCRRLHGEPQLKNAGIA